ncbi:hypothetical protein BUALT_Bualt15G0060500 [Buddleja alternifolia]|uniref:GTD-binding domain-containing protein n=1 Tax=Buddleja alternifolia TaxID=168488 RepID=A0AAV6WM17_9LAMI|nr:hypothetical protein BUALT_Bualt15G0060500 [Buddleja alternifolia]
MQIFVRFYPFIIVCSVLGFRQGLLKFILVGFMLMDCVACLKHLTLDYELGCGFFLFANCKQFLCLFLLFGFGLKFLYSDWLGLIRFLCDSRGKLKNEFSPKYIVDAKSALLIDKSEESIENLNTYTDSGDKISDDSDEETCDSEIDESDVLALRKLLKIERIRANTALSELEKERAAAATAAAEAMAMILKLQSEKSSIEMELSQHRRLSEEKQIHDQEVIQSLQWLVWRHESERILLEDELKLSRRKPNRFSKIDESEEAEEDERSSFNGSILDALENVLYSSRDDHDAANL